jgi:large subunit ribosomal protein L10
MKSRETKQKDLNALTESLQNSKSAMVVSFTKLTVNKDIEFRNSLRAAGAEYRVVKNTLARLAVKGTDFEQATESFKGVTAIAWTQNDPVILSKAVSKFMKDNADVYTFKSGVVDGRLVDLKQLTTIANLPSKEELISKIMFVINAQAQRIVTVINAVPRDLAVVIKQIGEKAPAGAAPAEAKAEEAAPAPAAEAAPAEAPAAEAAAPAEAPATEVQEEAATQEIPSPADVPAAEEAPATETQEEAASQEIPTAGENTPEADPAGDADGQ